MAKNEEVKNQEKLLELIKETQKEIEALSVLANAGISSSQEQFKLEKQIYELKDKELKLELQNKLLDEETKKEDIEKIKLLIKQNEQKKKQLELLEQENEYLKHSLEKNLGIKDEVSSIVLKLQEAKKIKDVHLTQEEASIIKQKLMNSAASQALEATTKFAGFMLDAALEFEKSARALMRAGTFSFEEAKTGLIAVTQQAGIAGVGLDQAGTAMVGLKTSFTGFTNLAAGQQAKVTALVATMERMGLSVNASAKFLDTATKSLGMSTGQATNFLSSLEGFAKQSGIPIAELSKNLEGATDKIALFGDKGTEVFKEMSLVSKQLGVEMNTLFNITERFTTFEGAADAAGKLNAVLGGDFINSVDLLTASMEDPAKAFQMLKMSMDQSGQSFDQLDNGMKRVIASSVGMTVEQAGKLFSQDINTATAAMREQAKTQEELNKIGADLLTIQEKFQAALVKLYPTILPIIDAFEAFGTWAIKWVITPLAEFLSFGPVITILQVFAGVIVAAGAAIVGFGAVFVPLYSAVVSYRKVMAALNGLQGANTLLKQTDTVVTGEQALAQQAANKANDQSVISTTTAGNAAGKSAAGFLKLGAGILLIGIGIALVIGSIALLASQIKDLSGEQMGYLLFLTLGVTAAFVVFGIVAAKMSAPLLAAATSVAAFGAAMYAAAVPISIISLVVMLMATRLTEMAIAMKNASVEMIKLGSSQMVKNFEAIKTAFEGIADAIDRIDSIKMGMLMGFGGGTIFAGSTPQQGREVGFNLTVTDQEKGTTTTAEAGGVGGGQTQVIQLTLDINSPIMLDKDKVGDLTHQTVKTINASANTTGITTNL